jgi:hypothetical protein
MAQYHHEIRRRATDFMKLDSFFEQHEHATTPNIHDSYDENSSNSAGWDVRLVARSRSGAIVSGDDQ